jgi:hypothetical protein
MRPPYPRPFFVRSQISVIATYAILILHIFQRGYGGELIDGRRAERHWMSGVKVTWICFECSMLLDRLYSRFTVANGNFNELNVKLSRSWYTNAAYDIISDGSTLTVRSQRAGWCMLRRADQPRRS